MSPPAPAATLPGLLLVRAAERPRDVALRKKDLGRWKQYSWEEYARRTEAVALGLLGLGVERDDRVAVQSGNRPAWVFTDLAVQSIGAVSAGVDPDGSVADLADALERSAAVVLVAEDEEQLDKALEVQARLPALRRIVVVDPRGVRQLDDPAIMTFAELEELGRRKLDDGSDQRWRDGVAALDPSHAAALVHTPRGRTAVFSHANLVAAGASFQEALGLRADDEMLSYLPLSHVAERVAAIATALVACYAVNFGEGAAEFARDVCEVQPTYFVATPQVWEQMMTTAAVRMEDATLTKRGIYRYWLARGGALAPRRMAGRLRPGDRVVDALGWLLLYRTLRAKLGLARARAVVSRGAPIASPVLEYFWAIGVPVRESYGVTESTSAGTVSPVPGTRAGTAGKAMPGVELRVAGDSEVLVRGPTVFLGYDEGPSGTVAAIDGGGWLHTGDLGALDGDGYLAVVGRKEDHSLVEELYRS